jgi:O-antigen biosynthesis protein
LRVGQRIRVALRPRPTVPESPGGRWSAYLAAVEPVLAAVPRVHMFGLPPRIATDDLKPAPLAVWIETGDPDWAAQARAGVAAAGQPATVLDGSLTAALSATTASHVLLVGRGCVPAPLALRRLGQAVALAPDAAVITTDEDRIGAGQRRHEPHFRPAPSPDRWLACDDTGRMMVVSREAAARAAREVSPGPAWLHELALRLALDDGGEPNAAHVPMLLSHVRDDGAEKAALSAEATARVLHRREPMARVESDRGVRRVRRAHSGEATVEVIVCLRDRPELLFLCMDSLLTRTAYDRLAVTLVDNGSQEPATLDLLARLGSRPGVTVIRDERPFNFAALNNAAARRSGADMLVFLNNDTEVVDPRWVETLLEEARRPEVGAVAPLLLYPDGTVQHAGAALGLHGYAGHPFAGLSADADTPFGRTVEGTRNWLAVTAACMMVQRSKFEAVGGFDDRFVVAGNDVDLCLRLTAAGYRSLCVPHAVLAHDESRSRGAHIDPGDFVRSRESYGAFRTLGDPFYNPNLTLNRTDCSVRVPGEAAG